MKNQELNDSLQSPLSERELEVLELLVKGKTNKMMAQDLFVSVNTIKTHVKNIYTKLEVENRTEATNKAIRLVTK